MNNCQKSRQGRQKAIHLLVALGLVLALFGGIPSASLAAQSISDAPMASVSAGSLHVCGIRTDGTIACWGDNSVGQRNNIPSGTFVQLSAGAFHTCAIKSDGTLHCWGSNSSHQVDATPSGTFIQISAGQYFNCALKADHTISCWGLDDNHQTEPPSGAYVEVTAGSAHACAIRTNNTVTCWGDNSFGESSAPSSTFLQISAGALDTCGVKTDGNIVCWGADAPPNGYGEVSNVPSTATHGLFIQVESGPYGVCALHIDSVVECWGDSSGGKGDPPSGSYIQVSGGGAENCGVLRSGNAICWGDNSVGELNVPSSVFAPAQIDAGVDHTCGVRADGAVLCWGSNSSGQLNTPSGTFYQVGAGFYHNCAIKTNGGLSCWGRNNEGQASPPGGTFSQISGGGYFSCGLKTNGGLSCWGDNTYHQVDHTPSGTFTQVSSGGYHSCAIKSDSTIACWGDNTYHQVDHAPAGTFTQIASGGRHSCAISTSGTITCWGDDTDHQVGNTPSGTFTQIAAGFFFSCALRTSGSVTCWGDNTYGQLNAPSGSFFEIAAGDYHACGIQTNGVMTCWGNNGSGQFGTDVQITSSAPPSLATGAYSHTYTATGTPAPTFSLTSGALPTGLTLNATSGLLSGTPTVEGLFTGTVTASNGFRASASQNFSITVDLNPPGTVATATKANTAAYTFGNWTNQAVTVTLAAYDAGTGVAHTYYTIDGGSQQTYSSPFTISTEGDHTVAYWSVDFVPRTETQNTVHVKIDESAPTISGSPTTSPNANGWYNGPVTIQWICNDTFSGIASCPADHVFNGQGTNLTVNGTATDNVGFFTTATSSPPVNIDLTSPTTGASGKKADNTTYTFGTWTSPSVTVTLNAFDSGGSGVANTFYAIDGGGTQTYTGAFTVNTNGDHTLVFWSVDNAGNIEASHTVHVQIALSGPNVTGTPTTAPDGLNGWYKTPPTIHWTCTATNAPVASCPGDQLNNQVVTDEGPSVTVTGVATDTAGNSTTGTSSPPLKIDHTPPSIVYSGNQGTYTFDQTVNITCSVTDAVSGVASVSNCTDISGPAFSFGYGITFSQTATATDNAGNQATGSTSFTVLPPASTPQATLVAYNSNQFKLLAYVVTGRTGNRPSGFLSYSDANVTLSNVRVMSLTISGIQATIYGTANLANGTAVTFRLDAAGSYPNPTVRLRLSNGYDSGDQHVLYLRVSPIPSSASTDH